ncbi:two-component regulator propeller domain-containing protein [uncultured Bacteroides sp.]|uniref:hybrid sensor histidine kinase/response regulator transcription factor n=1 Tax=uncultured Bacteroides sp. TaxID=162156 RepID=UPI0025E19DCF|nr:two-component regulator propeller domain-containing protein [uncultured Bacteroides sp.]
MKRRAIFFLSLLYIIMGSAKGHYFKHLGVSDGLSQVCIPAIYQDELGAVWLGTTEGLNRYNGKDVKIFRPSLDNEGLTNNEINELCGDKKGKIYMRSGNDLIKLDIYKDQFTCLRKNDVKGIFCREDTLWINTQTGIYYYSDEKAGLVFITRLHEGVGAGEALYVNNDMIWVVTQNNLVAIPRRNPDQHKILISFSRGKCVSEDSSGNLWVGTWDGLYRISPNLEITQYTNSLGRGELSDNQVRCVLEDDYKRIWVGTFRGLDCYDPATNKWGHYTRYGDSSNTLSHNSILSLHKDIQGNIWVGTYYGGVNVFNSNKVSNHFYYAEPLQEDCLSFPVVGKMVEDNKGYLWICTEGGGLNCYNPDTGIFSRYQHREGDDGSVGSNNLKSIYYRKNNNCLYVGSHFGGLFVLDLKSNKGHTLHHKNGDSTSLPHEIVNDVQEYKHGLALLTQAGPVFMDPVTEKFSPLSTDTTIQKLVNKKYAFETFLIDSKQRMWLASATGGVICVHLLSSTVTRYMSDIESFSAIGKFKVVHIFEDSFGRVYFCTIGSGVFEYQDKEQAFRHYGTSNQCLPSDYCYYICESVEDHRLFILHRKGISVFNREKGVVEDTYYPFHQTYSQGSALYRSKNGTVYISGTNGLALFQEQSLNAPPAESFLNFDKLYLFNEEISPNDKTGILTEILAKTSDLYLNYQQNNITVEFATFNYNSDRNRLFEYCLDGFDKSWTQTSGTTITYTNLPPGDYILKARPLENEAKKKEIRLNIHISAPFYATVWAYLFYCICLLGVMVAFIRFKTRQAALKSSLEFERKEKERIEELNQVKLRFFTNISHEFRTPLTLILGQIEVLMQMDKLGTAVYNRVLRIYKNAWHMRNLISELLDFRKQEQGYLKLKVEEQNIVAFTRQIYMCFYEYAQKKEITYRFDYVEDTIAVWFDAMQLQKVVFNLLSNAFKYTPNKGNITVEVRKISSQAVISVSDSGAGIPEEHISKIFERFYQTDNATSSFTLGTGIGLALAKGIMNMHHGNIEVKSIVAQGSKFTLSLPLGNRHFSDEEMATTEGKETVIVPEVVPTIPLEQNVQDVAEASSLSNEEGENKPVVLLVDDNEELLAMLEDIFHPMYEVHIAHDGREGLEMARQIQPDLILSDVMMPEMSGKELCYKIKTNVELSHISVILLTAQTSVEYIVEGLMFGADDYVTKPFNVKVLMARCNNLIKNKKRLIAHYAGNTITESPVAEAINERDKELLAKCVSIIKENFENQDFDVTTLATQLCMGRSKLYMQFKQITGLTPNEFILKVKLDEAMALLKNHPEFNISEISIRLGFSSPRYFSKSFKTYFGVSPQAVRSKKGE